MAATVLAPLEPAPTPLVAAPAPLVAAVGFLVPLAAVPRVAADRPGALAAGLLRPLSWSSSLSESTAMTCSSSEPCSNCRKAQSAPRLTTLSIALTRACFLPLPLPPAPPPDRRLAGAAGAESDSSILLSTLSSQDHTCCLPLCCQQKGVNQSLRFAHPYCPGLNLGTRPCLSGSISIATGSLLLGR